MHFFPGIYESKTTKKTTSFSNPLSGAFYSNRDFLKNCNSVPRSISNLDHIKQLKNSSNSQQYSIVEQDSKIQKRHIRKQQKKRIQREIVAVHATARMAQTSGKNNKSLILRKRCIKGSDQDNFDKVPHMNLSKTFAISHTTKGLMNKLSSGQLSKTEKGLTSKVPAKESIIRLHAPPQQSCISAPASSNFPDIQILVLDQLHQKSDFLQKTIRINLHKYFKSFFKKQLSGLLTPQFLLKVEHYLLQLHTSNTLDQPTDQYPSQLFTASTRLVFMNRLLQLEGKQKANMDSILAMVRFYCVPSRQFRESCLRDVLLMLAVEVYEKFNCDRHQEYVLLGEDGTEISEIVGIGFSTSRLFLASRKNKIKLYANYLQLVNQCYIQGKKLSFNQNIKINFRNKLASGKVDEGHFNYSQNYDIQKTKRNFQVQNAQNILKKRMQTHRVSKYGPKQQTLYYQPTLLNQPNPVDQSTHQPNQQPQASSFWRVQNTRISPQRSHQPKRTRQPESGQSDQNRQRARLDGYLKESSMRWVDVEVERKIRGEFRQLMGKNDIFDFRFNYQHKERVMKQVLRQYFLYFKDKQDCQVQKIMGAIKRATICLAPKNDKSSGINQVGQIRKHVIGQIKNQANNQNQKQLNNKEMKQLNQAKYKDINSAVQSTVDPYQKINQVQVDNVINEENKNAEIQIQQSLSWQEFKNLRITIECIQPKQVIMSFIANYLNFNQFGQLSKADLFKEISLILEQKTDPSTVEVIAEVIWSWFQSNSIIENGFIRRVTLESWYHKYRIVYCMLVSLIFGTNRKTALDLAYQIIV